MFYLAWLSGLLRRRWLALAAVTAGIAVSVALVATMAGFFALTRAQMTDQAIADVAVDWQVQLAPGANLEEAVNELTSSPGYTKLARVGYFDSPGMGSVEGGTTQVTGPGKVLGLESGYRDKFPSEIRDLLGDGKTLLAQQTAANLHAQPGSVVMIRRAGLPDVHVTVDAIVDLPLSDSLFQAVGTPPGSGPRAPPDNVILLPLDEWHSLFDPVAAVIPEAQHVQLHVTLPHDLPSEPSAAFANVQRLARNYETRLAGAALIGDNLSARLDVARSDALYAEVLFFFLGFPGVLLAAVLTIVLISSGGPRRRREQALLRLRGATVGKILGLAALEPAVAGITGGVLGIALASVIMEAAFGIWGFEQTAAYTWYGGAALAGAALPVLIILYTAWREANGSAVTRSRAFRRRPGVLAWERFGLDFVLLGLSTLAFWLTARGGYEVVVAQEGVPRVSVSYSAFLPPLLLWSGAILLAVRLTSPLLARKGRVVGIFARPIAGALSSLVGASLSRQRLPVAGGLALIAAAIAFATSTAIFNSTYQAQAQVDAELTNGADVTVTGPAASGLAERLPAIRELPGVAAAEPMQHRFAYVGTDLQDLYGVQPASFGSAAQLSDSFFANGNAGEAMSALKGNRDGVLVSAETVQDFQLSPGDLLRLRLQNSSDNQYHVVEFHYLGIAREFPTAPSDSFLVANADYIAQQTAAGSVEMVLVRTDSSPDRVAEVIRQLLGPGSDATVRDIAEAEQAVHSSLTAISLRGLTRVELSFAAALAAAGAGLVLLLGFEERRRTLAIAAALGARPREIGAFVWSEAALILAGGGIIGGILGWLVATMLVKLLTQVFDPPPEHLSIPWIYVAGVPALTTATVLMSALIVTRLAQRSVLEMIRRL